MNRHRWLLAVVLCAQDRVIQTTALRMDTAGRIDALYVVRNPREAQTWQICKCSYQFRIDRPSL